MGRSSSSAESSTSEDRRRRRKSHKKRKGHRRSRKSSNLETSVKQLTDTVLKIGKYLNLSVNVDNPRRSRSTEGRQSRSRSRSPLSRNSNRSPSISPPGTPRRRVRSPFSVPPGDNEEARKLCEQTFLKATHVTTVTNDGTNCEDILEINAPDDPLIKLLGVDPGSTSKSGDAFHSEVASRWKEIAKSGLPKEERDAIKSKLKPPPNCEFGAPALNPELTKAVIPIVRSRDEEIGRVQTNLQVSISGLGHLLSSLLDEKEPLHRASLISKISDAGRFLVGTQYSLSLLRRRIIKDNVKDPSIKELLQETPIYPNLFEADLGQKIKQMQTLAKVGTDITKASGAAPKQDQRPTGRKSDTSRTAGPSKPALNYQRPLQTSKYRTQRSGRPNRK